MRSWPPFTSSMIFELFRATPPPDSNKQEPSQSYSLLIEEPVNNTPMYYVRLRYKNQSLPLPMCAEEGQHLSKRPEFCTFEAFKEGVSNITPADWRKECSSDVSLEQLLEGPWEEPVIVDEPDFTPHPQAG